MRKIGIGIVIALIGVVCIGFVATGVTKCTAVYVADYHVAQDGQTLTLDVGIADSMGYTRGYHNKQGGDYQYLTF